MVAYFSSKLFTYAKTALAVILLWFCVVGTQWFGYIHSISHANYQQPAISQIASADGNAALNHSSDVCHLLDALTLAGFIPATFESVNAPSVARNALVTAPHIQITQTAWLTYQSRAPPSLIL